MTQATGRATEIEAKRLGKKTYFIFNAILFSLSFSLSSSGTMFPEQMIDKCQSRLFFSAIISPACVASVRRMTSAD